MGPQIPQLSTSTLTSLGFSNHSVWRHKSQADAPIRMSTIAILTSAAGVIRPGRSSEDLRGVIAAIFFRGQLSMIRAGVSSGQGAPLGNLVRSIEASAKYRC